MTWPAASSKRAWMGAAFTGGGLRVATKTMTDAITPSASAASTIRRTVRPMGAFFGLSLMEMPLPLSMFLRSVAEVDSESEIGRDLCVLLHLCPPTTRVLGRRSRLRRGRSRWRRTGKTTLRLTQRRGLAPEILGKLRASPRRRRFQRDLLLLFQSREPLDEALLQAHVRDGRHVLAIGGNEEAAILSGIRTNRIKIATFALAGLAAGLASAIAVSRISMGQASAGTGMELQAIAAVILGGTSIYGGVGAVWRSIAGVLLLALINNGFNILNADPFYRDLTTGLVILAAIGISAGGKR